MSGKDKNNDFRAGRIRPQRKKQDQEQIKMKNSLKNVVAFKKGVDFSGNWMISDIAGNMDKLMQTMGMNIWERHAAKMYSFGVRHVTERIKQNGDDFVVTVKTELGTEKL